MIVNIIETEPYIGHPVSATLRCLANATVENCRIYLPNNAHAQRAADLFRQIAHFYGTLEQGSFKKPSAGTN
jgi:hypothetical protein